MTGPQAMTTTACKLNAEQLNQQCQCAVQCHQTLHELLTQQGDDGSIYDMIINERPHLLAKSRVFVSAHCLQKQRDIITAIETVIAMPAYQQRVLAYAPDIAHYQPLAQGVFFGYDFHLEGEEPKLIEINSNAGGALINALLVRSQQQCCERFNPALIAIKNTDETLEQTFLNMFFEEWRAERGAQVLKAIAIVDEHPDSQYMLPEFLLFKKLFEQQAILAIICDPSELTYHDGALWHEQQRIDLVYNRLTDFALDAPTQQALLTAYLAAAVVVTPHPRAHALYADKRNLVILSDEAELIALGVEVKVRELLLAGIAHTTQVKAVDADALWATRKHLFFKPAKGYGSKAAYRGDKLTKRVFSEIINSDYVAQTLVQPSQRRVEIDDEFVEFKLDLRHYVYRAYTQLVSARLYQGQTTNFRTPGGGFAVVKVVAD
jgi:hypothetical protein